MMYMFKKGTPAFGMLLGICFALTGVLLIAIGFWKTVLLMLLFGLGYFLGATNDAVDAVRDAANRVIPQKESKVIDFKHEVTMEQPEIAEKVTRTIAKETPDQEDDRKYV